MVKHSARIAKKKPHIVNAQIAENQLLVDTFLIVDTTSILNVSHAIHAEKFLMARTLLFITINTFAQNMVFFTLRPAPTAKVIS